MKKFTLILLLLIGSFAYSQGGSMTIVNFSGQDISFRLLGNKIGNVVIDCQPLIRTLTYTTLTSGSMVTYDSYNTSSQQNPAINEWLVNAGAVNGPEQFFNVASGNLIPQNIIDMTTWAMINIKTISGSELQLGRDCGTPPIVINTATGGGITAQWVSSGLDITIVIT